MSASTDGSTTHPAGRADPEGRSAPMRNGMPPIAVPRPGRAFASASLTTKGATSKHRRRNENSRRAHSAPQLIRSQQAKVDDVRPARRCLLDQVAEGTIASNSEFAQRAGWVSQPGLDQQPNALSQRQETREEEAGAELVVLARIGDGVRIYNNTIRSDPKVREVPGNIAIQRDEAVHLAPRRAMRGESGRHYRALRDGIAITGMPKTAGNPNARPRQSVQMWPSRN